MGVLLSGWDRELRQAWFPAARTALASSSTPARMLASDSRSLRTLLGELLSREAYALDRYLSAAARDLAWDDAAFFQTRAMRLTAAELEALSGELEATFARFRSAACDDVPPEALPVRVLAFGFPQPGERP